MISYRFSLRGKSHIDRDVVCQDSSCIKKIKKEWRIICVADGVGSAKHSDIGSKMATACVAEYCKKNFPKKADETSLVRLLRYAYESAWCAICEKARIDENDVVDYDTTLSVGLFNGKMLVYGHSGDGGIVVRRTSGEYEAVTKRQKGADGTSVIPLRPLQEERSWVFGIEKNVAAVLMATDGIYDRIFQPYLLNIEGVNSIKELIDNNENKSDKIYVTAAHFFMNPKCVYKNAKISEPIHVLKKFTEAAENSIDVDLINACIKNGLGENGTDKVLDSILEYNYLPWSMDKVTDDKSIACIINNSINIPHMPDEYYMEPNWKKLQKRYTSIMYGQEFESEKDIDEEENKNSDIDDCEKNPDENIHDDLNNEYNENLSFVEENNLPRYKTKVKKRRKFLLSLFLTIILIAIVLSGSFFKKNKIQKKETTEGFTNLQETVVENENSTQETTTIKETEKKSKTNPESNTESTAENTTESKTNPESNTESTAENTTESKTNPENSTENTTESKRNPESSKENTIESKTNRESKSESNTENTTESKTNQ